MRKLGVTALVALAFVAGSAIRPEAGESDVLRKSEVCAKLVKAAENAKKLNTSGGTIDLSGADNGMDVYVNMAGIFCDGKEYEAIVVAGAEVDYWRYQHKRRIQR